MRKNLNTRNIVLLLICIYFSTSCSKKQVEENNKEIAKTNLKDSTTQHKQKRIVVIQPFDGVSPNLISSLYSSLEPILPKIRLNEPVEFPESSYSSDTNRFRADSLIRFLRTKSTYSSVVIGITENAISRTTNGYQDFEIIGLAFMSGHSCVVSTHLYGGDNVEERLLKSALHELAHTEGLKHCDRKSYCYMKGAKGGEYPIDQLTDFCPFCKAFLKRKGWNLK